MNVPDGVITEFAAQVRLNGATEGWWSYIFHPVLSVAYQTTPAQVYPGGIVCAGIMDRSP